MTDSLRLAVRDRQVWLLIEVLAITIWAVYLAWDVLDFDRYMVPAGVDYVDDLQGNFAWERAGECGLCALWNGDINGGAPAFADSMSPLLHPLVIVTTLAWGAINGSKVVIVLALIVGGLGQLWIGYEVGAGRAARLLIALVAVAAGHLTAPLEGGLFAMTLANASASVVFASIIHLFRAPSRRSIAITAVCAGLFLLAGQGYMQISMALLAPVAVVMLLPFRNVDWGRLVRSGAALLAMALLIAAPLLVPFLHLFSRFGKETDSAFSGAQPFRYVPLNLVIDDWDLYHSEMLGLQPFPMWYMNYVGWIPVMLAFFGVVTLWARNRRLAAFLVLTVLGSFFIASAAPLRVLYDALDFVPRLQEAIAGLRNIQQAARLGLIPLLGLSTVGLDALLRWRPDGAAWSSTITTSSVSRTITYRPDLRPVLIVLMIVAIMDVRGFALQWVSLSRIQPDDVATVLGPLQTETLQWVQPPVGERWVSPYLQDYDLKVADMWRPWHLRDRAKPPPYREATRGGEPPYAYEEIAPPTEGLRFFEATESPEYVSFEGQSGTSPCTATGNGGNIDVECNTETAGRIQILENRLPGWNAAVNGESEPIQASGQWLAVDIPAGESTIELRYRPWDVWIGLALSVIGLLWATYWIAGPRFERREAAPEAAPAEAGPEVDFIPYETDR